jgi:hypothetical protein
MARENWFSTTMSRSMSPAVQTAVNRVAVRQKGVIGGKTPAAFVRAAVQAVKRTPPAWGRRTGFQPTRPSTTANLFAPNASQSKGGTSWNLPYQISPSITPAVPANVLATISPSITPALLANVQATVVPPIPSSGPAQSSVVSTAVQPEMTRDLTPDASIKAAAALTADSAAEGTVLPPDSNALTTLTPEAQAKVAAPKSGMAAILAGAGAGFFVGGPIGAAIGAGAAAFLGKKSAPAIIEPSTSVEKEASAAVAGFSRYGALYAGKKLAPVATWVPAVWVPREGRWICANSKYPYKRGTVCYAR